MAASIPSTSGGTSSCRPRSVPSVAPAGTRPGIVSLSGASSMSGRWTTSRGVASDARPHAGILSDSFLFTRHSTTYSNKSRGRANAVSRALLCYDFLEAEIPVDIGIDLADPEEVASEVDRAMARSLATGFGEFSVVNALRTDAEVQAEYLRASVKD